MIKRIIAAILRRLLRRPYGNIVAPLKSMADDLNRLVKNNEADNRFDMDLIDRIKEQVLVRVAENQHADQTERRIRNLIAD